MIIIALAALILLTLSPGLALEVRVGVYDNPPLFFKEGDRYSGFYIDVLEEIAKREGWEILYVYDKFPKLLDMLKNDQIDLMTAMEYIEEVKAFAFTNETMIVNWGVLVAKEDIKSILELEGKRIAGMRGCVYFSELQKLAKKFEINCEFLEIEGDFKDVMIAVSRGNAEVGVVSRIYASMFSQEHGLRITNVIFAPIELKFASIPEKKYLLDVIDRNLAEMKGTMGSAYHVAMGKWFGETIYLQKTNYENILVPVAILALFLISSTVFLTRIAKKKAKEAFESKHFLQSVFNAIQDGISVLDPSLRIIAVNHAMEKWYAKNMPLIGKKCYEAYHNRTSLCENCPTLKAMESKKVEYAVVPGIKGSQVEWLELFSYPVLDKSGKVVAIVEFVRDITEKKKAEENLRKLLDEYQYFWDKVNDVLYIHDLEGRILRSNRKGIELTGYRDDVTIWDIVENEFHGIMKEKIKEIVEKRRDQRFEIPIRSRDGKQYWLEVLASPVTIGSRVVAIQGIARDVTERKQLIERLEKDIQLIAHIIDRTKNSLAVVRAYCELSEEIGDEAIEKALESIDETVRLLGDLDKAWLESEKLREFLFGKKS